MIHERGASMIEILGVITIAGMMTAAAIWRYNVIRNNQMRKIAFSTVEELARNTEMLMGMRGDYTGVSVQYLVEAGALANANAPIGGDDWSVTAINEGVGFSINLTELSQGECEYFSVNVPQLVTRVIINNVESAAGTTPNCFSTNTNNVSFVIE